MAARPFRGPDFFERARLVLPTDEFFPAAVDSPRACAEATFERVKRHAGLGDWAVTLEGQPEGVDPRVSPSLFVQGVASEPGGTFSIDEDGGATFLGFGIFQANAAFGTRQSAEGFSAHRLGYLTQAEHGYALALFLRLKGIAPGEAMPHCCRNARGHLKRALVEIDRDGVAEALAKVAFRGASSAPATRAPA